MPQNVSFGYVTVDDIPSSVTHKNGYFPLMVMYIQPVEPSVNDRTAGEPQTADV